VRSGNAQKQEVLQHQKRLSTACRTTRLLAQQYLLQHLQLQQTQRLLHQQLTTDANTGASPCQLPLPLRPDAFTSLTTLPFNSHRCLPLAYAL
jgi:hypothetical protein